jgi:hypothetical protein
LCSVEELDRVAHLLDGQQRRAAVGRVPSHRAQDLDVAQQMHRLDPHAVDRRRLRDRADLFRVAQRAQRGAGRFGRGGAGGNAGEPAENLGAVVLVGIECRDACEDIDVLDPSRRGASDPRVGVLPGERDDRGALFVGGGGIVELVHGR